MNKVTLIGNLTKDPDVRYSQGDEPMAIARYTLAVQRRGKNADQTADFISCVAFGRQGEFAEKYLRKGMKIAVIGHIQTGSYKNKDGQTVYTTEVVVDEHEFVTSKAENEAPVSKGSEKPSADDFMVIPDDIQEELPFM